MFVSRGKDGLLVTQGKATMRVASFIIRPCSNFETPNELVGADGKATMRLTDQELVFLVADWLRLTLTDAVKHERKSVGYEFHLRKA